MSSPRCLFVSLIAATLISPSVRAQPIQLLKDVWVATNQSLYEVDYDLAAPAFVSMNPGDQTRSFRAIAFEHPALGGSSLRNLVAVDGTTILRIADGAIPPSPIPLWDAGSELTAVNTVATSDAGTVFVSGYSRRKRVFELWELVDNAATPDDPNDVVPQLVITGGPQLTDAVYVSAEDVVDGSVLAGGGLLAVSGRSVLFFPANPQSALAPFGTLVDARNLPIKNNAQIMSADLVRRTDVLMLASSDRKLVTVSPTGAGSAVFETLVPDISGRRCADIRNQRLLVRNARGQSDATTIVSDVCGQVVRYDFDDVSGYDTRTATVLDPAAGLVALAVGEGNLITCVANDPNGCALAEGFVAQTQETSDLLVLQIVSCDPRVEGCTIEPPAALDSACDLLPTSEAIVVDAYNNLVVNSLLSLSLRRSLCKRDVEIILPPSMFGAGLGGTFGALILQADGLGTGGEVTANLEIAELVGFELGIRDDFVRPEPDIVPLLNQDIVAYAPDNPDLPSVRGFEGTPVTIGKGSTRIGIRGGSFIGYGLQLDVNRGFGNLLPRDPTPDPVTGYAGGRPDGPVVGSQRLCNLASGTQIFVAEDDPAQYFVNLVACLWQDEEELLEVVIPAKDADPGVPGVQQCVSTSDHATIVARLGNTTDKLIKALNAAGPNAGAENFQSVISQLDQFDQAVASAAFAPACTVYKNELSVRSQAFRFQLLERALPSLPLGGFR